MFSWTFGEVFLGIFFRTFEEWVEVARDVASGQKSSLKISNVSRSVCLIRTKPPDSEYLA